MNFFKVLGTRTEWNANGIYGIATDPETIGNSKGSTLPYRYYYPGVNLGYKRLQLNAFGLKLVLFISLYGSGPTF